jgi:hypothetical protein
VLVALAQHGRTLPGIAQAGDGVSEVLAVAAASFMLELNGASPCSAGPSAVPRAAGGARSPGPSAAFASKPTGRKECALVARVALYVFGHEVFAVSTDRPSRSEPEHQLLDAEVELADEVVRARNSADDRDLPRITARHGTAASYTNTCRPHDLAGFSAPRCPPSDM